MSDAHELDLSDPYFEQFLTKTEVAAERRVSVDTIDRMVKALRASASAQAVPAPSGLAPARCVSGVRISELHRVA